MADKIRYTLEKFIPDLLALQKRRVFSESEVQGILHQREEFEYALQRRTHNLANYMQLLEYEYGLERLRRQRNQELHIKKVTTRDYAIVKRIIYIWDRIMNRFRYNIELWKQYLSFCYIINSKKHFFKVVTKALSFNPFNIDLWLAAALYELEKAHNPIKARKIFYQALRINSKNIELWGSYLDFELSQLQYQQEDEEQNGDGFLSLNTVQPVAHTKLKKIDGVKQIIKLALDNCTHTQIKVILRNTLANHNQQELANEVLGTEELNTVEQISAFIREHQNDSDLFDKLHAQNIDYSDELIKILNERVQFDGLWALAFQQQNIVPILLEEVKKRPLLFKLQLVKNSLLDKREVNLEEIKKIKSKQELLETLLFSVHIHKSFSFEVAKTNLIGNTNLFEKFLDEYFLLLSKNEQQQTLDWLAQQKQFCPLKYHMMRKFDFVGLFKLTEYHPKVETWKFVIKYTQTNFPERITQIMNSVQFLDPTLKNSILKQ